MSGVLMNDAAFDAVMDRLRAHDRDRLNALNRGIALVQQTRRGMPIGDDDDALWEIQRAAWERQDQLRQGVAQACAPWFEVEQ